MSNQDRNEIAKELNNIAHLYNLNENEEKQEEKKAYVEPTFEQEMESISLLYNL